MTAPVRDPQTTYLYCESCSYTFTEYEIGYEDNDGRPEKVCPRCGSDRYRGADSPPEHWAANLTPEERGEILRACIEVRHLTEGVSGDAPRELWDAASDTLRELQTFIDDHGEQS